MLKHSQKLFLIGFLALVSVILFVIAFQTLPLHNHGGVLAIDWRGLHFGLRNGGLDYGPGSALKNPPWSLWFVRPLGFFSFRTSWAILSLFTLVILIASVPFTSSSKSKIISVFLLIVSFPSIRHIVDGNFEGLMIGGILLLLHGYRNHNWLTLGIGILLSSAKPHESWLLLIVLAFYLLKTWNARRLFYTTIVLLVGIIPSLPWIEEWWVTMIGIEERNTLLDFSMQAVLLRLDFPISLIIALWLIFVGTTLYLIWQTKSYTLERKKAGLLIAASLIAAPYAAGNNVLVVLAIGIMPLIETRPKLAVGLLLAVNGFYFTPPHQRYFLEAYYWLSYLLITWGVLSWVEVRAKGGL